MIAASAIHRVVPALPGARSSAASGSRRAALARRAVRGHVNVRAAVAEPDQMSIRTYVYDNLNAEERVEILKRPRSTSPPSSAPSRPSSTRWPPGVTPPSGEYTSKFDGVDVDAVVVRVEDLPDPILDDDVREAFDVAYENIKSFTRRRRTSRMWTWRRCRA